MHRVEHKKVLRFIYIYKHIQYILFQQDIYTLRTLNQFSIIGIVYLRLSICAESADNVVTHVSEIKKKKKIICSSVTQ